MPYSSIDRSIWHGALTTMRDPGMMTSLAGQGRHLLAAG